MSLLLGYGLLVEVLIGHGLLKDTFFILRQVLLVGRFLPSFQVFVGHGQLSVVLTALGAIGERGVTLLFERLDLLQGLLQR